MAETPWSAFNEIMSEVLDDRIKSFKGVKTSSLKNLADQANAVTVGLVLSALTNTNSLAEDDEDLKQENIIKFFETFLALLLNEAENWGDTHFNETDADTFILAMHDSVMKIYEDCFNRMNTPKEQFNQIHDNFLELCNQINKKFNKFDRQIKDPGGSLRGIWSGEAGKTLWATLYGEKEEDHMYISGAVFGYLLSKHLTDALKTVYSKTN